MAVTPKHEDQSVWRQLGFSPEDELNLEMRSRLMLCVEQWVERSHLSQREAAKVLRMSQPRLNKLLRGHFSLFNLETLITLATRCGAEVRLVVRRPRRSGPPASRSGIVRVG